MVEKVKKSEIIFIGITVVQLAIRLSSGPGPTTDNEYYTSIWLD